MNVRNSPILLIAMLCCASCAPAPRGIEPTPDAAMARRLAPLCPVPLRPEALDGAADYLAAHPDALSIVGALNRLDKEARLCRGQSP